ncbi:MAG: UDP-2,3-diacylglucosamine diphosphatase [Paracoccaceae bacterium]
MSQPYLPTHLRALFLSDLHLGARSARPALVLDFLAAHRAETIYLVGDIFDLWHGGRIHWTDTAEAVVNELTRRARAGTRVVYLAGNHDAVLREPGVARLPEGWDLREAIIHRAADGQRYLVLHGDQADSRLFRFHIMTRIGSRAEAAIRALDDWLGRWAQRPRAPHHRSRIERSLARFNGWFVMGRRFERRLVRLASAAGAQGVICGHSHRPALRPVAGALYANCGDWVDSFTALTEDHDGALRLLSWGAVRGPVFTSAAADGMVQAV